MKKYVSVWALLARSTFLKIMLIVTGMAALECGMLWVKLCELRGKVEGNLGIYGTGPENLWEDSFAWLPFLAALGMVFAVLLWAEGKRRGSKVEYAWKRLLVTKRQLISTAILYNMLCLVILFAAQIAVAMWFLSLYRSMVPAELVSPQLFFLSFMRSKYLHNVLPLMEIGKWIRNFLMLLAFSIEAGKGAYEEAAVNKTSAVCLFLVSAIWFYSDMGVSGSELFLDAFYAL